jgi:hypothetical protein
VIEEKDYALFADKNFGQLMVQICNTFAFNHKQMISLRKRIEAAYGAQPKASRVLRVATLQGFAIAVHLRLKGGSTIEGICALMDQELLEDALRAEADMTIHQRQAKKLDQKPNSSDQSN